MSKNEPAFPWIGTCLHQESGPGLTKRELLAAMAMQGFCVSAPVEQSYNVAKTAVKFADALLAELKKTEAGDE